MTQTYLVRVVPRLQPPLDAELRESAHLSGYTQLQSISSARLYLLHGTPSPDELDRICRELLSDPIVEDSSRWRLDEAWPQYENAAQVIVTYHPGVTDSVAENALRGIHTIGITSVDAVRTGWHYLLGGDLTCSQVEQIAAHVLSNGVIQDYSLDGWPYDDPFAEPPALDLTTAVQSIPLRDASPDELLRISREGVLALDLDEMTAIQDYYRSIGREPTDAELETLAQTWSEHCSHKTFKAIIDFEDHSGTEVRSRRIDGLLKTFISGATAQIQPQLPPGWIVSAFKDNAGVVRFDDAHDIAVKVETHNHPSALEPFGGANTGVGGVIRDVVAVSAKPIACTDVLCFGPLDTDESTLPANVLSPRYIAHGVVAGIQDYGNKMGIPIVNGAILFDPGYLANPLVYCGCIGLLPHGAHRQQPQQGDLIVVVGGRTGRDGIHGATFSSEEMTAQTGATVGAVVQIGNPITEKLFTDVIMKARDQQLYTAITDCGAGGLSSAVGEMGADLGVSVELERVPLKYPGLKPWQIWLSEAQERMVLAVPPQNVERFLKLCSDEDVEATVIGEFTGDGRLSLRYGDLPVADLAMHFLHDCLPRRHMKAVYGSRESKVESRKSGPGIDKSTLDFRPSTFDFLLRLLADPSVASKESVIRRYDHEVQGATVGKPLVGVREDGPADGAALKPVPGGDATLVVSCGINPWLGRLDAYAGAAAAIDEAVRNNLATGGSLATMSLLDNFCWGNPQRPETLGALVRACEACYDLATAYKTPFISGKDSLYNEYFDPESGQKVAIPPTLLITATSVIDKPDNLITSDLKAAGNALYLIGASYDELGGSLYSRLAGVDAERVPQVRTDEALAGFWAVEQAIHSGLVQACHDLSEGGLAIAAAEMCIGGLRGLEIDLARVPIGDGSAVDETLLFGESPSRFLLEVAPEDTAAFEALLANVKAARVGSVRADDAFIVKGSDGQTQVKTDLNTLRQAFMGSGVK